MSTEAWPADWIPAQCTFALEPNLLEHDGGFGRSYGAVDLLGERWRATVSLPPCSRDKARERKAFFNWLARGNLVSLWDPAYEQPTGTMRGTPTLASNVAQGAASFLVTTLAGRTMRAGDYFGIGTQLFEVKTGADATADGSGAITLATTNRTREAITAGAVLTWYRPTAVFRLATHFVPILQRAALRADGVQIELIESPVGV